MFFILNKQEVLLIKEVGQSDVVQAVVPETSASPRSNECGVAQASTASCKSPTCGVLVYCGHTLHDKLKNKLILVINFYIFLNIMFQM
jgi:hypothetical protein